MRAASCTASHAPGRACAGDIVPPTEIKKAMELEAEAERKKRADILTSEGMRTAAVNKAEGLRQATALEASGHAEAAVKRAHATGAQRRRRHA